MGNIVERGPSFYATFDAAASLSTIGESVYISADNTVAVVNTNTNYAIGTVGQKSSGGEGSSVGINLFLPTRKAIAGGTVTAGGRVMQQASTAKFVDLAGTLTSVHASGIAITGAGTDGELFEFIPQIGVANAIVIA